MVELKKGARIAFVATALLAGFGALVSARAQNAPAGPSPTKVAVENRRAAFTLIGNSFRQFGAVVKGAVAYDDAEATKRAARVAFLAGILDETFPEGSNVGEPDSKAKADVWSNRADFDKKLKDFQAHARELVEVVAKEKGATEPFKAAVAALGQDCKNCHDGFKLK